MAGCFIFAQGCSQQCERSYHTYIHPLSSVRGSEAVSSQVSSTVREYVRSLGDVCFFAFCIAFSFCCYVVFFGDGLPAGFAFRCPHLAGARDFLLRSPLACLISVVGGWAVGLASLRCCLPPDTHARSQPRTKRYKQSNRLVRQKGQRYRRLVRGRMMMSLLYNCLTHTKSKQGGWLLYICARLLPTM